jgi:hypothetical protein
MAVECSCGSSAKMAGFIRIINRRIDQPRQLRLWPRTSELSTLAPSAARLSVRDGECAWYPAAIEPDIALGGAWEDDGRDMTVEERQDLLDGQAPLRIAMNCCVVASKEAALVRRSCAGSRETAASRCGTRYWDHGSAARATYRRMPNA